MEGDKKEWIGHGAMEGERNRGEKTTTFSKQRKEGETDDQAESGGN